MKSFNEWLWNRNKKQQPQETNQPNQLKDAVRKGSEWHCPSCDKPLTEDELSKSICTGCWNKLMPHHLAWYGIGKPVDSALSGKKQPYEPTVPLGSRTWKKETDWDYTPTVNPGDANRIGGM